VSEAQRFLGDHTAEVEPLVRDYNLKYWDAALSGGSEDAALSAEAKERMRRVYARTDEFETVKRFAQEPGHDPITARQLKLLSLDYAANQMDPEVLAEIVRREEEIEVTFNAFRATLNGARMTENDLRRILREEKNVEVRRTAWEASKQIGATVSARLLELVRIRNRESRRLGYRDFYAMSLALQEIDEDALFGTLGALKDATTGPFVNMKADLDRTLATQYGVTAFEPYPWMYGDPFFQDAPAGAADVDLDQIFAGKDIEALTLRTFNGLNLPIADLLPRSDFYEREGKCQHAFCTHIDRKGDVRVLCNIKEDEYWMTTMLHEFGHAIYDKNLAPDLPFLLRVPAHTMTTEAIAMLMGRLTRSPEWLSMVIGLGEREASRLRSEIERALRMQMLIFMRWGLLVVHFERELYRDPDQDLNALWWKMAAAFQNITPPLRRALPDWASKIHFSSAPVYYQNYILGELTASQLETAIKRHLGKGGTNALSFVDKPAAGAFLKDQVFRHGASMDWQDTLKAATGELLNPDHFMRQFVGAP
jgi:peptidyl-dipeptidase A